MVLACEQEAVKNSMASDTKHATAFPFNLSPSNTKLDLLSTIVVNRRDL
jgi:hypothetical protein